MPEGLTAHEHAEPHLVAACERDLGGDGVSGEHERRAHDRSVLDVARRTPHVARCDHGCLRALLDREHGEAKTRAARWEGRLVVDDRVSHILVVAESPELDFAVNRRIEAALRALKADYELTVPMPTTDDPHDTTRTPGDVVPLKD